MKTATVRDLRNRYADLLAWVEAGQEILITRSGRPVARLIPESARQAHRVRWSDSPAVRRDRRRMKKPSAAEIATILQQSSGGW
jgi:prevent-host-death family protein